jgi:hypothetical protein
VNRHSMYPQHVAPGVWYYEETGGLALYWAHAGKTILVCRIPWRKVWTSLARHGKPPAARAEKPQEGKG